MTSKPPSHLKSLRLLRGLKRRSVARHIGVTERTLVNWEDEVSFPTSPYVQSLAQVYNVDPNEICGWNKGQAV